MHDVKQKQANDSIPKKFNQVYRQKWNSISTGEELLVSLENKKAESALTKGDMPKPSLSDHTCTIPRFFLSFATVEVVSHQGDLTPLNGLRCPKACDLSPQ